MTPVLDSEREEWINRLRDVLSSSGATHVELSTHGVRHLIKRIDELTSERDELRLALRGRTEQLNAVPVDAIRFEYANSIALSVTGCEIDEDAFNAACIEINEWLKTVQP